MVWSYIATPQVLLLADNSFFPKYWARLWPRVSQHDRDTPKDTLQSRQRLVEQTYIVIPIWDKGFISVNHILLLPINNITSLAGNHLIISADNTNTGTPFPGTSSWRWLHSPCQMSKFKCLLQSWLPVCKWSQPTSAQSAFGNYYFIINKHEGQKIRLDKSAFLG